MPAVVASVVHNMTATLLQQLPYDEVLYPREDITDFDSTIGAFEGGVIAAVFLYGITTVQAYTFLRNFSRGEPLVLRIFVVIIWMFEGLHSAIVANALYWITVTKFGQSSAIDNPLNRIWLANALSAANTCFIQAFFAYRVFLITGTFITPLICAILSACSLVGQFVLIATGYRAKSVFGWQEQWRPLLLATLVMSTIADVLIAANLCWGLWKRRRSDVRSDAHRLVDKVISWGLETCSLTCVGMTVMLILFMTMENFAWICVWLVVSRTFSNSFLASLNGRKRLRRQVISENLTFVEVKTSASLDSHSGRPVEDRHRSHILANLPAAFDILEQIDGSEGSHNLKPGNVHCSAMPVDPSSSSPSPYPSTFTTGKARRTGPHPPTPMKDSSLSVAIADEEDEEERRSRPRSPVSTGYNRRYRDRQYLSPSSRRYIRHHYRSRSCDV